jgi:hypothetical protein
MSLTIQSIEPENVSLYGGNRPSAAYLRQLLKSDYFIAIAALKSS